MQTSAAALVLQRMDAIKWEVSNVLADIAAARAFRAAQAEDNKQQELKLDNDG